MDTKHLLNRFGALEYQIKKEVGALKTELEETNKTLNSLNGRVKELEAARVVQKQINTQLLSKEKPQETPEQKKSLWDYWLGR